MQAAGPAQRAFQYCSQVHLHYELRGSGTRPVVLLHGFGASLETWRTIQPRLEPHFLLYLVDLKGFGLSSKPDDGHYSIDDQADIIASFVRQLEVPEVSLVGHSYGGAVALAACCKLAVGVRSLVLMNSPAVSQKLPFFMSPLRSAILARVLGMGPSRFKARFALQRISFNRRWVTPEIVERYARSLDLPGSLGAMRTAVRQILPEAPGGAVADLSLVRCPVLIVWGDHDRIVFPWQAELLRDKIPGSRLAVIPDCGHMPHEERPEETALELVSFLAT